MTISCSFHPSQAAHFQCYDCDTTFCESCISVRKVETYGSTDTHYFCPACETEVELIGISNSLPQFWKRLGEIFLYPLQPMPLIMTLLLSILGAMMPMNLIVQLFVWVLMMKYAYAVLIDTAKGSLKAPDVSWQLINSDVDAVFKQVAIFAVLGFLAKQIFLNIGPLGGIPFIAVTALCIPIIIMVLVATNSMTRALNPLLFFPIIFRIGYPYLLLYLFLMFLYGAPSVIYSFIPEGISIHIWKFLTLFFGQFYMLIGYHLMGYVLLQYHREIGYGVDYEYFLENSAPRRKKRVISDKERFRNTLGVLIKSGRYDRAIPLLRTEVAVDSPDIRLAEKYLQLLKLAGETEKVANYSPILLDHLVHNARKERAMQLLQEIMENKLSPPVPAAIMTVASWYEEKGEYKKALESYVYCIKKIKGHDFIPEAYFRLARVLHERAKNSPKAQKLLQRIVKSFPNSPFAPQAREYMQAMV